jgi:hypothetical protein
MILQAAAARSSPDGDSPDSEEQRRLAEPAEQPDRPANPGELSEAALAAFIRLGLQRDRALVLAGPSVDGTFGDSEQESGVLVRMGLAGAEPVLLALLAAHWSVPDREPEARKHLRRRQR